MNRAPSANSTSSRTSEQVLGHKSDTATTTVSTTASLMAYVKGLVGGGNVPTADATTNADVGDVVGNKTDAAVEAVGTTKSIIAYAKGILTRLLDLTTPLVATGTTDIDDSVQDESSANFVLLTLAPAASSPMIGTRVILDLAKATTGYGVVESTATIQFYVARKVDGTNWRTGQAVLASALSGTLAAGRSVEIEVGDIGVTEQARIEAIMSADATSDMEIPYAVIYRAAAAATITPVAAGA